MREITKYYVESGVLANDRVSLEVKDNEIHALIGENGAGKSTLMKILYGLERADSGKILFRGKQVSITSPRDANALGIGMVQQHFRLIPQYTVTENVILGIEPTKRRILLDKGRARREVSAIAKKFSLNIDCSAPVGDLSVGQMQIVEIMKLLYRKASFLILDEPTSVLTRQEIDNLFGILKSFKKQGKTIVLITHKLDEVSEISERVTVLRHGKRVAVRDTSDTNPSELSRLMIGREVALHVERPELARGKPVYRLESITLREKGRNVPLLDRVTIEVHQHEIVGVAGVSGNGLSELEDVASGLRKVTEGHIFHNEEEITNLTSIELREMGLAYVPADRLFRGSSLQSSVTENMIICNHHYFIKRGILNGKKISQFVRELTEKYSIMGEPDVPIGTLSGGNIQKVILARELSSDTDFIIFAEPTWGLDVSSSEFVYRKIIELRSEGAGILLISSNLDEVMALSDTIVVMYKGRVVMYSENKPSLTKELIGEYMLGLRDDFREVQSVKDSRGVQS